MVNKRGISPVVAMALLLLIAVTAGVTFSQWLNSYVSELTVSAEGQQQVAAELESLVGDSLFIELNEEGELPIESVTIDGETCDISGTFSGKGYHELRLGKCLENRSGKVDVVIQTGDDLLSKSVYVNPSKTLTNETPSLIGGVPEPGIVCTGIGGSSLSEVGTCQSSANGFHEGSGTQSNPYGICNCDQFLNISSDLDAHYTLVGNVSCGGYPAQNGLGDFNATLDGNNFTVSGLQISETKYQVGVFNTIGSVGSVKNLHFDSLSVDAGDHDEVGGIAGRLKGNVSNVQLRDSVVTGNDKVGGHIGYSQTSEDISCLQYSGDISLDGGGSSQVGGLIGTMDTATSLLSSNSHANITSTTSADNNDEYAGGLIGRMLNGGTIEDSYHRGLIDYARRDVGGLVGSIEGRADLINTSHEGDITLHYGGSDRVGGLIGYYAGGDISDTYSRANITHLSPGNNDDHIAGFIGQYQAGSPGSIQDSSHEGKVDFGDDFIAGFIGETTTTVNMQGISVVANVTVRTSGSSPIAGLVANYAGGDLSDISVESTISHSSPGDSGNDHIGGVIGRMNGNVTITDSSHSGAIDFGNDDVGGIVARGNGYILELTNVNHTGAITTRTSDATDIGGLVGSHTGGDIVNSFAIADITNPVAGNADNIGGLVGRSTVGMDINDSYHEGVVTFGDDYIAGLIANPATNTSIYRSYHRGNITISGDGDYIGGLVANLDSGNIVDSYSHTNITNLNGNSGCVTGLGGRHVSGWVNNSYFVGSINGQDDDFTGVAGCGSPDIANTFVDASNDFTDTGGFTKGFNSITNSYWNNMTTNSDRGLDSGSSAELTAIQDNSAYFYNSTNAPFPSWDSSVWQWSGSTYPTLAD